MSSNKGSFVDNIGRRTWDLSVYEEEAKRKEEERKKLAEKDEQKGPVIRGLLQQREKKQDFLKEVGKTIVVSSDKSKKAGFYCDVCECLLTDSKTYIDHINGRNHQKKLGMSMNVARVSSSQVAQKLHKESVLAKGRAAGIVEKKETVAEKLKRLEREAEEKKRNKGKKRPLQETTSTHIQGDEDDVSDAEEGSKWARSSLSAAEEQRQLSLAEARAWEIMQSRQIDVVQADAAEEDWEEEESEDEDFAARLAALKGNGGAGNSSTSATGDAEDKQVTNAGADGDAGRAAPVQEEDEDAALMAAMGITGFGTSSKKR